MMTTDFDTLVDAYEETGEGNLMRKYIEKATFLSVLKDVRAKSVLDLGCGEGNYTRTVKRQGAAYVVGVDISEKMIDRARQVEETQSLGIEYRVRDVRKLEQIDLFDIATAVYLFPHAQTEQDLIAMAQAIYNNLKPNGRLVAVTRNPDLTEKHLAVPEKYDIYLEVEGPIQDGARITITILTESAPICIVDYYWSKETYERVLKKVGFRNIEWHAMIASEEGIEKYGENYWQEYLTTPHITVLECHK